MLDDSLTEQVKQCVSSFTACDVNRLTSATRLLQDLGMAGDDGWDFMLFSYREEFNVDMSAFEFSRHFMGEGDPFFYLILVSIKYLLGLGGETRKYVPITIGDLIEAARTGTWRTPNHEPA